jgi:hypothetical protein
MPTISVAGAQPVGDELGYLPAAGAQNPASDLANRRLRRRDLQTQSAVAAPFPRARCRATYRNRDTIGIRMLVITHGGGKVHGLAHECTHLRPHRQRRGSMDGADGRRTRAIAA